VSAITANINVFFKVFILIILLKFNLQEKKTRCKGNKNFSKTSKKVVYVNKVYGSFNTQL